ncbi:transglycosylase domain-containing protein [Kitasatospora sp. DSM 101779]|uniref:transglycosylase domain-containing protein n=1 Tax=Kitasatospora sp. DSM 101779 TaxID=2853165 RepID=UPI0021DA090B|nr:transglycosylase domain-containing protein [Kitasatospora sp. DSM 101779]MCU7824644.1 transglycosylase domain-containing protein [Kitasatospora sp. DSM 101779]
MPRTSQQSGSGAPRGRWFGRRTTQRRSGWRRLVPTWRTALAGSVAAVLFAVGLFALGLTLVQVPDAHAAATAQSNTWLYSDGTLIARTGQTNRQNVPLDRISPAARHAALAAEDRNFYHEGAVNLQGLTRAAFNTATGKATQGGSTITQQYVKNTYLSQKQSVTRKVKELFIAIKVDATESKDDVLAGYLNTAYYGRGAYGIQAAAQAYFGIDADRLDAAQGAYLAALLNAPSAYDVATATPQGRQNATNRWNYVLDGMVQEHWLSAEQRAATAFPEVEQPKSAPGLSGQAGYLVAAATDYLTSQHVLSDAQLAQGGYTVTLSVDAERERQLRAAVRSQLTDNLDPAKRKKDADAQAGAVSLDPRTGAVLALYGGSDATEHWIDNATRQDYQAGSTFKAIALAAALDSGARTQAGRRITADTVYDGTSGRSVRGGTGTPYAPPNEGGKDYGQITLQQATDWSVNSVYAQLAQDTGLETVRRTAVAMGLPADTPGLAAVPSIPLGAATPSVLQMAGAYAALDNDGKQITPWLVKSVGVEGEQVPLPAHSTTQAVSPEAARAATAMLQGVVDDPGGTGWRAGALNRPVAGKTGTTDNSRSVWFVGYTPELVTAVGLFGQDPATGAQVTLDGVGGTGEAAGGRYPTLIWTAYMKAALAGEPVSDFPAPKQVRTRPAEPSPTGSASASPSTAPSSPAASAPAEDAATERPERPWASKGATVPGAGRPGTGAGSSGGGTDSGSTGGGGGLFGYGSGTGTGSGSGGTGSGSGSGSGSGGSGSGGSGSGGTTAGSGGTGTTTGTRG